jgi:CheY-like chemotaxis protein/HPt (histidine-containing phosphotransfer) domain-containing protein
LRDLRVLVVDDHPTARTIFARYLESFGFSTGEAASGAEAIDELETTELPYQLVLMDWKMPGMDGIEAVHRIRDSRLIEPKPEIIMVSAYGREEVIERAESEGVASFLVKPVSPSSLLDALLDATGHGLESASRPVETGMPSTVTLRGARVLLVEDNDINQQVAAELLGQAGIDVTIAADGKQGVAILSRRPAEFDGVLMDIQMPVMDGYTATREIRKDARFDALPIIAMTANAMAGDREKALSAGMNDHVAKPIDVKQLFEVLDRWIEVPEARRRQMPEHDATGDGLPVDEALPEIPGIDTVAGIARVGGSVPVYQKLLDKFRRGEADAPQRIRTALVEGDLVTAQREAHTLKGVAGNLGAGRLAAAAKAVEFAVKEGVPSDALLGELETELGVLLANIPAWSGSPVEKTEGAQLSESELSVLMDQLEHLLADYDAEAINLVAKIASRMSRGTHQGRMQEIGERIEDFEFDEAGQLLADLRRDLE